jgi:cytochrome c peroxidase
MKHISLWLTLLFTPLLLLLLAGTESDAYEWNLPKGFPLPRVPENNPMTNAKVELGRYLFYDVRLSGNETQSCATCHQQDKAFSDGATTAVGSTGDVHPRNSMSLTNAAYNPTQTWVNPNLTTLEKQIVIPMFNEVPVELGLAGMEKALLERLQNDELYPELFVDAFPEEDNPITVGNTVKALASFTRSLVSFNSAYDRYVYQRDKSALSESARLGMNLFFSERFECHHCHGGFNFTQSIDHANLASPQIQFHNTGLYNIAGTGAYPEPNTGLFEFTRKDADNGKFRPPSLRNVALTAPYMHDGSVKTLEDVLAFYEAGGRNITEGENAGDGRKNPNKSGFVPGFTLTREERQGLLDFLRSLTDETFTNNPAFSNPFEQ